MAITAIKNANLTNVQNHVLNYLLSHKKSKRRDVLYHLVHKQFVKIDDRTLRAEVAEMVDKGIPVCTNNRDGYYLGITEDDLKPAIADLLSRADKLRERANALQRAHETFNKNYVQGVLF